MVEVKCKVPFYSIYGKQTGTFECEEAHAKGFFEAGFIEEYEKKPVKNELETKPVKRKKAEK